MSEGYEVTSAVPKKDSYDLCVRERSVTHMLAQRRDIYAHEVEGIALDYIRTWPVVNVH